MERDLQQYNAPLDEWKECEHKWIAKASDLLWLWKDINNPYEPMQGSAPTQKQALAALNREINQERAATGSQPAQMRVQLMEWTLDIEQKQLKITSLVTEYKKDEGYDELINTIESEQQGLLNDLFTWEGLFEEVAGPIMARLEKKQAFATVECVLLPSQLNVQPEAILLPVPSCLASEICDSPELKPLRAAELKLREGRLHDLLEEIRLHVTLQSLLYHSSKKHSVGQAGKTRTGHAMEASRETVQALHDEYNFMRPLATDCRAPILEHGQKARSWQEKERDAPKEVEKYMMEHASNLFFH
ncbi:hypothetical protein DENSPDRAFT_880163 [Dentipellis sp. KUC8613]|nr:hypothetical protein DENSPDRAFT_880163 [Dentipellis sp. KUC8613]